jgi:hypothetical protein
MEDQLPPTKEFWQIMHFQTNPKIYRIEAGIQGQDLLRQHSMAGKLLLLD